MSDQDNIFDDDQRMGGKAEVGIASSRTLLAGVTVGRADDHVGIAVAIDVTVGRADNGMLDIVIP